MSSVILSSDLLKFFSYSWSGGGGEAGAGWSDQSFSHMLTFLWDLRAWLDAGWLVRFLTTDNGRDQLSQPFLVDSLGLGHHRHVIYVV